MREHASIIITLGVDLWSKPHVHDGKVLHELFLPIMQVIGHLALVNGMVRRMIADELFEQMTTVLDVMDPSLPGGLLNELFSPSEEKEKKIMNKA